MEDWMRQIKVPTVVLFALTLLLFALMWVPGVIQQTTYEGAYPTIYLNPFANDYYSVFSGLLTAFTLPVLYGFLRFPIYKRITIVAVMLELAAVLAFLKIPLGIVFRNDYNTPLSYAIGFGTIAAMVLAFLIQRKVPFDGADNPFSKKQMALYALILAAATAMTMIKWCWKYEWSDMTISYANYSEGILSVLSRLFTAFAANLALLHCLGLIKGNPKACGILSLAAAVCAVIATIEMHIVLTEAHVVVLLPTYIISAIQIVVGLRLLLGKRKETGISANEVI